MSLSPETKNHIDHLAEETLTQFGNVSNAARERLGQVTGATADAFAAINTMTSGQAVKRLSEINSENRTSVQHLVHEPAIARVVVKDAKDKVHTYYICRNIPILGMASYRSPVGSLASREVGEEVRLPAGTVEVLEIALLNPELREVGWDSNDTVIKLTDLNLVTIQSLRALLDSASPNEISKDALESILANEIESANIQEGIRRSMRTKMELRDQPILDRYQDTIFRLPISSRLLILGPPGTGKTTTLIRRLGQKLDTVFLDGDEQRIVEATKIDGSLPHNQSWLMFTPTELLKQYVKEAFAREDVPAPESRIKTWSDYRHELGRRVLGVLRTTASNGLFVLKDSAESTTPEVQANMAAWYGDFNAWQKAVFLDGLRSAAKELSEGSNGANAEIGKRLSLITDGIESRAISALFIALNAESNHLLSLVKDLKETTDTKIRESLNLNLNRNKEFLKELASFLDGLQENSATDVDELDDAEVDEDDEINQPKTPMAKAVDAYNKAVRAYARAQAKKRNLGKNTRYGKIVEWLGNRNLAERERVGVGASLLVQSHARRFVYPIKSFVNGIPSRYRAFRRLRQSEGKWYLKDAVNPTDITPLELDLVILGILQSGTELLNVDAIMRNIDAPAWSSLKPILGLFKNQILVDEATDFSPVQLACMACLAHPRLRSFIACGDFNQRLTTWGSRSPDDLKWVFTEIEVQKINVTYRQTRQLNELAKALIQSSGSSDVGAALPEHIDSEGVPPVLIENVIEHVSIADWLANRIQEIESSLGTLPSIAVLVNSESEVQRIADVLDIALSPLNIRAVACPKGQVMGQGNDVRVFDVQHIKGMEFEAVFFIGVDRLAIIQPELFDKYLYVGTTRAATYLGLTCEGKLPSAIEGVRPMFSKAW